jgi:hypothetical protein
VSAWQLLAVWAMSGLAAFGIPAYFVGWWNGRRCLRAVLDATRLRPVVVHEVRIVSADTATTLPLSRAIEPPWLWSEQRAGLDAHEREVRAMIEAAAETLPRWAR